MGLFEKPKTYEMRSGGIVTTGTLRSVAGIKDIEIPFRYLDVHVKSGDLEYTLRHVSGSYGWHVLVDAPAGQEIEPVIETLKFIMGGRDERKIDPKTGYIMRGVDPTGKVSLREVAGFIDAYAQKLNGEVQVSDFRLEKLPSGLYKKAEKAGLPMQEVR